MVFALVAVADFVGDGVEHESLLGADAVVELVEKDSDIGGFADGLGAEDGDVARAEGEGGVWQGAVAGWAEAFVGGSVTMGAVRCRGEEEPIEVASEATLAVVVGVDPPWAAEGAAGLAAALAV